jgi:hypothetical protein
MPFKSQAQRRKFAELLVKGEISAETYEEWNRSTGGKKLPERVGSKRGGSSKGKRKSKTKAGPLKKPTTSRRKGKARKR